MRCPYCNSILADFSAAQTIAWFYNMALRSDKTLVGLLSDALVEMEKTGDRKRIKMYEDILTVIKE